MLLVFNMIWRCVLIILASYCWVPRMWAQQPYQDVQNVLLIIGDDHAITAQGSYGNDIIQTPHLDTLAASGVQFNNAYANAPLCSASRQSLLTGKYPHATGVNLLFTPFPDEQNITIAEQLRQHDYATAAIGKMHFNNWIWSSLYKDGLPDHGYDVRIDRAEHRAYLEKHPPKKIPDSIETWSKSKATATAYRKNAEILPQPCYDEDCEGTFLARKTVEFMQQNKDRPFFATVGFHEPHAPFNFPIEYRNKYSADEVILPTGSPEDDRWVPEIFRDLTVKERRGIIASYYTSTTYMDKNIGLIMEGLENLGLEKNTLVIYLGDHGYLLNEHKRFEKHTMWEESIKAPLVIKAGEQLKPGRKLDEPVEFIDIAPTILEMTEVTKLRDIQGKSILPLLTNQTTEHKEYVFAEFLEDNKAMVAGKRWKYIFSSGIRDLGQGYATGNGPPGITHRLYDLKNDPGETTNVAGEPENKRVLKKLQLQMLETFKETAPYAIKMPTNMTLEGKLVWFCYPRDVGVNPALAPKPQRVFHKN